MRNQKKNYTILIIFLFIYSFSFAQKDTHGKLIEYKGLKAYKVKKGDTYDLVAKKSNTNIKKLLKYNDLKLLIPLQKGDVVFLERKRRKGTVEFHDVKEGETMYYIAQKEAIRFKSLLKMNRMKLGEVPKKGEKLNLRKKRKKPPITIKRTKSKKIRSDEEELKDLIVNLERLAPPKDIIEIDFSNDKLFLPPKSIDTSQYITEVNNENSIVKKDSLGNIKVNVKKDYFEVLKDSIIKRNPYDYTVPMHRPVKVISHTVKKGETLRSIAKKYKVIEGWIIVLNDMKSVDLKAGQEIFINKPLVNECRYFGSCIEKKIYHKVKAKDNLTKIAKKYKTTTQSIIDWNNLKTPILKKGSKLVVGITVIDSLVIPKKNTKSVVHIVKKGETLYSISRRYDVSIKNIKAKNKLKSNKIITGQKLKIK